MKSPKENAGKPIIVLQNYNTIGLRGGTGMKNQIPVGYRVFKNNQARIESGSSPRKTLPENTCITSEVIHRHQGLE